MSSALPKTSSSSFTFSSWASVLQGNSKEKSIPTAFRCSISGKIMDEPVIGLCGHLFDYSVVNSLNVCPIDSLALREIIPLSDLKKRIEQFKERENTKSQENLKSEKKDSENPFSNTCTMQIKKAHMDDIHGLVSISSKEFVSCSKDGTVTVWGKDDGKRIKNIKPSANFSGYKFWGTALTSFKSGMWASGTRDGYVHIWDQSGNVINQILYNPSSSSKSSYICKDRNKKRINCITEAPSGNGQFRFYTGTPKYLQLWDGNSGKMIAGYLASDNDWVYCIEVLEDDNIIVVVGSCLEYWDMSDKKNPSRFSLLKEDRKQAQRPLISSITCLRDKTNMIASACFDGSVKFVDMDNCGLSEYKEHRGRVWSVINCGGVVLSSADDATIKAWDIREKNSVFTIDRFPGRVSSLLEIADYQFIAGSCPDNPFESEDKAVISFWDMRKGKLEEKKDQ